MSLRDTIAITKALADSNRLRMILALRGGELCVCQVNELFGLAASTTSKHLSVLYQAKLLDMRREGRWIYYQLPGKDAPATVRRAIDWVAAALAGDQQVAKDAEKLRKIQAIDPVELCKRQGQK